MDFATSELILQYGIAGVAFLIFGITFITLGKYAIDKFHTDMSQKINTVENKLIEQGVTNKEIAEYQKRAAENQKESASIMQATYSVLQNLTIAVQTTESNSDKRHTSLETSINSSRNEMHAVVTVMKEQLEKISLGVNGLAEATQRHEENAAQRAEDLKVLQRQLIISTQDLQITMNKLLLPISTSEPAETPEPPPAETNPEASETPAQAGIEVLGS